MTSEWTTASADAWLLLMARRFEAAGIKATVVGGVAKRGRSDKDLDLRLTGDVDAFLSDLDRAGYSIDRFDDQMLKAIIETPDGRFIDIF